MYNFFSDNILNNKDCGHNVISKKFIEKCLNEHYTGKSIFSFRLWAILNFELWHQIFIDNNFEIS